MFADLGHFSYAAIQLLYWHIWVKLLICLNIIIRVITSAKTGDVNACSYKDKFRFSHDIEAFMAQDCKEFQGELFGICNLFRDLSDKLFTSEILELHEKQGQQHTEHHSDKQELTSLGSFPTPAEGIETFSSVSKNLHPSDIEIATTDKPVLEDLGILYAHRNKDIINSRPRIQQKIIVLTGDNNLRIDTNASWKKKIDGEENVVSTRDRKKIQYGRLAQFKGMRVVEFSKWVLSATSSYRESLLRNYKRRTQEA
ncbi:hypothetical protein GOBAR_DD23734 [Gossypium barbadense]|nr:hypothetical protein GOBAR_DD23734 [Gossypium barbadense]